MGIFFSRINHQVFFGFIIFSPPKTLQYVSCGVNGHQEVSLSHKQGSHVDPGQEQSNIAHYFHMPAAALVVLHHCKLSSV